MMENQYLNKEFENKPLGGGRDESLDLLKFILIILVALCHSIEPFRYNHFYVGTFYSVVYAFHMPLFILLSGYFSKNITVSKLKKGVPKLIETYLIMGFIGLMVLDYQYEIKSPQLSEWYLLSLVFWRILAWCIDKLKLSKETTIFLSFVFAFISFFLLDAHSSTLSCMRTMLFLPYFIIGYYMSRDNINTIRKHWKPFSVISIVCIAVLIYFSCHYLRFLHVMEYSNMGIYSLNNNFHISYLSIITWKAALYLIGLLLCLTALSISFKKLNISKYGRYTLFIYCMQMYLILLPMKRGYFTHLGMSLSATALVVSICCILSRYKLCMNFITNPISTFIKELKTFK